MLEQLNKARILIKSDDQEKLVYACLELRLAIESYVYRKLEFYSKRHGKKLLYKKWQPNKAIKILNQLEPKANTSYQIKIAENTGEDIEKLEYKHLGSHHALTSAWINKTYNKLGHFLHLQPESRVLLNADKEFLDNVVNEIEKAEKNKILSNFATTITFGCSLCEKLIVCCEEALPDLEEVVCPNDQCSATYEPAKENENWFLKIKTFNFDCPDCKRMSEIYRKELNIGQKIVCINCGAKYQIVGNEIKLLKVITM